MVYAPVVALCNHLKKSPKPSFGVLAVMEFFNSSIRVFLEPITAALISSGDVQMVRYIIYVGVIYHVVVCGLTVINQTDASWQFKVYCVSTFSVFAAYVWLDCTLSDFTDLSLIANKTNEKQWLNHLLQGFSEHNGTLSAPWYWLAHVLTGWYPFLFMSAYNGARYLGYDYPMFVYTYCNQVFALEGVQTMDGLFAKPAVLVVFLLPIANYLVAFIYVWPRVEKFVKVTLTFLHETSGAVTVGDLVTDLFRLLSPLSLLGFDRLEATVLELLEKRPDRVTTEEKVTDKILTPPRSPVRRPVKFQGIPASFTSPRGTVVGNPYNLRTRTPTH